METPPDCRPEKVRKPLDKLISELESAREHVGKTYVHLKSRQGFQLLFVAFDGRTNEMLAVYCLLAYTRLKFTMPLPETHARLNV